MALIGWAMSRKTLTMSLPCPVCKLRSFSSSGESSILNVSDYTWITCLQGVLVSNVDFSFLGRRIFRFEQQVYSTLE